MRSGAPKLIGMGLMELSERTNNICNLTRSLDLIFVFEEYMGKTVASLLKFMG